MFVTNHVLSGVVIGRLLEQRPVTAFAAGVGSHLVLDWVPHWGCGRAPLKANSCFFGMRNETVCWALRQRQLHRER